MDSLRHLRAGARGMQAARAYEEMRAQTMPGLLEVLDVSGGIEPQHRDLLAERGIELPVPASADLLTFIGEEVRVIEVKARAGRGPIFCPERERATMDALGSVSWLYAVGNVTQPRPIEMFVVNSPALLPWRLERPAEREKGTARGVRHEAVFRAEWETLIASGSQIEVEALGLPSWSGAERD